MCLELQAERVRFEVERVELQVERFRTLVNSLGLEVM
jgi:hypothetical protein